MTSTINTNGIDGNYPIPGQNNNSQGFRDNFTAIKNNLNTAETEITDLQNNAVLKAPLTGIPLDNNMANTLISNAAVRTFRNTTYNLGNNVSGTVVVDCTLGDVQFATITGNTTFQFAGWAPTSTKHTITLDLTVANAGAFLMFPAEVVGSGDILENNITVSGNLAIAKAPHDVTNLVYDFSTIDCGNTILVEPVNRSYQISQIEQRQAIIPTGYEGDRNGDVAFSTVIEPQTVTDTGNVFTAGTFVLGREYIIVSTGDTDFTLIGAADSNPGTAFVATGAGLGTGTASDNTLITDNTTGFYVGMPVEFTGDPGYLVTSQAGTLDSGRTYTIVTTGDTDFTLIGAGSTVTAGSFSIGVTYTIISTGSTDFTLIGAVDNNPGTTFTATGAGTGTGTAGTFATGTEFTATGAGTGTGTAQQTKLFGGVSAGTDYYVTFVEDDTSFAVSTTLDGSNVALSSATGTMQVSPIKHVYYATGTFDSTVNTINLHETTASTDQIELAATSPTVASYGLNQPIVFSGSEIELGSAGLLANTTYYIATVDTGGANTAISISRSRTNGVADGNVSLSDHTFTSNIALGNVYTQGHDIWKRIRLDSF